MSTEGGLRLAFALTCVARHGVLQFWVLNDFDRVQFACVTDFVYCMKTFDPCLVRGLFVSRL